jgi:Zn-dependent alcohol dehydrogenase
MGAGMVIVLDRIPKRLETAKRFGADEVVNVDDYEAEEDRIAEIQKLTGGRGADLVVELVGLSALMPEGLKMTRHGGTFLEIGNIVRGSVATIEPWMLLRGRKIVGSVMYTPAVLATVLGFLQKTRDRYPFHQMITHRYPLAQINEAFAAAEWAGKQTDVGRAALNP